MIPHFSHIDISDVSSTSHGGRFSVDSLEQALKFCESIAKNHYENFPVASKLLPAELRSHVLVIYAFSRIADDIADEYSLKHGKEKAEHALTIMHHFCSQAKQGSFKGNNPLWLAMQFMFEKTGLPLSPFERLIEAFKSDIYFHVPDTLEDILRYCHNSANPIGELLLRLHGLWNNDVQTQSDALCTALQITNFMQDISIDRIKGRCYVPLNYVGNHELVENYLADGKITPNFSKAISRLMSDTEALFDSSKNLPWLIAKKGLRAELLLIHCSGHRIFVKCMKQKDSLPSTRPILQFVDYVAIFSKMLAYLPMILLKR
jgi:squalene synthase HpnC